MKKLSRIWNGEWNGMEEWMDGTAAAIQQLSVIKGTETKRMFALTWL